MHAESVWQHSIVERRVPPRIGMKENTLNYVFNDDDDAPADIDSRRHTRTRQWNMLYIVFE